jgi:uncharacterized protein YndB with AHSA1/START domain
MASTETFELEYIVRSSPRILYNFLRTPSGLSEWFSDQVDIRNDVFTFRWDGSEEKARLVDFKDQEYVRFEWVDGDKEGLSFEMRVKVDELTGGVALLIRDEAEPEEIEETRMLWDAQVQDLMQVLGS